MDDTRTPAARSARELRIAGALVAVLFVLMLAPRIPGQWGGGLWQWLAGYTAVALVLSVLWLENEAIARAWSAVPRRRRWVWAATGIAIVIAATLAMRDIAPGAFNRFSRENGLWEPICLLTYWGSAILVFTGVRDLPSEERRPWLGVVGAYTLLGLEEIDYFGIFGGIIGHVDGVYAGSLHDLLRLFTEGVLPALAWAVIAALIVAGAVLVWRRGYVDPRFLWWLARRREIVWAAAGFAFLAVAAAEEAHVFGWVAPPPSPEEVIELYGALCIGVYTLELVTSGRTNRRNPRSA